MKARNLVSLLQKGIKVDTEITIMVENSEKEFEIIDVSKTLDKKTLICKLIEKEGALQEGDSIETQKERATKEILQDEAQEKVLREDIEKKKEVKPKTKK